MPSMTLRGALPLRKRDKNALLILQIGSVDSGLELVAGISTVRFTRLFSFFSMFLTFIGKLSS
jgi:hypothetical protein